MTRALVVGCGSIGSRHVRNLRDLGISVTACDIDTDRLSAVAAEHDLETTTEYLVALERNPDYVLVCTPPTAHVEPAIAALDRGINVFVEKPMAPSVEATSHLVDRADDSDAFVYVACNMRFHPPVALVDGWLNGGKIGSLDFLRLRYGNALPNWRPGDYREYYSASAEQGGGIILDAIHELDLANHWMGGTSEVLCAANAVSDLDIDTEDVAEVLFRRDGCLAEVHMDYLRPVRSRTYECLGSEGMIRWHAEGKNPEVSRVTLHDAEGRRLDERTFELTLNEMYVDMLRNFLDCVEGNADPPINAHRGMSLVKLAELAKTASDADEIRNIE